MQPLSNIAATIVAAYETLGMTEADIASQEDLDPAAVKFLLYQNSKSYREAIKTQEVIQEGSSSSDERGQEDTETKEKRIFSDEDMHDAALTIVKLGAQSDVDRVRFDASRFIIDECQGRHKLPSANLMNQRINILVLNEEITKVKAAKQKSLQQVKEAIEV